MTKLFFDNKYTKCYYRIINKARIRNVTGYTENHHIIPKGIGGNERKINKVKLTAKEHYICHLLLVKMVQKPKHRRSMAYALFQFRRNHSFTEWKNDLPEQCTNC